MPLLLIQARDDPLVPFDAFASLATGAHVRLLAPEHGGHVAFVGREGSKPWLLSEDSYWAERSVVRFLADAVGS